MWTKVLVLFIGLGPGGYFFLLKIANTMIWLDDRNEQDKIGFAALNDIKQLKISSVGVQDRQAQWMGCQFHLPWFSPGCEHATMTIKDKLKDKSLTESSTSMSNRFY